MFRSPKNVVRLAMWGIVLFLLAACANGQNTAQMVPSELTVEGTGISLSAPETLRSGWDLVWHDEFDGQELDRHNWTFDIGGNGWGNNELEYYTGRPENVRIENGMLVIEARAEKYGGQDYTSTRIKSQGLQNWTYGRFEARMKIPSGQGVWPAFWLLGSDFPQNGWPACGEIDIMENIGKESKRIHGSAHGEGFSGGNSVSGYVDATAALAEDFHIYAIEWDVDSIRWFLDEEEYFSITPETVPGEWVFDHSFFIIINQAIGGNWPGTPNDTTIFPQQLLVDYVRVYQRAN